MHALWKISHTLGAIRCHITDISFYSAGFVYTDYGYNIISCLVFLQLVIPQQPFVLYINITVFARSAHVSHVYITYIYILVYSDFI